MRAVCAVWRKSDTSLMARRSSVAPEMVCARISKGLEDEFKLETERTKASFILSQRKVELLREKLSEQCSATAERFTDDELLEVLTQLHERNDAHADFKRFRQKARVLQRIRSYVQEIWQPGLGSFYEVFVNLHDLVVNKKFFTRKVLIVTKIRMLYFNGSSVCPPLMSSYLCKNLE